MTWSHEGLGAWSPPAFDAGGAPTPPAPDRAVWALTEIGGAPPVAVSAPPTERDVAWNDGHAAGVAAGERRMAGRLEPLEAMISPLLERMREAELLAVSEREADVIALAMAVARHLVLHELSTDPALLRDLVRRALAMMPADAPVRVRVHPEDLALLETGVAELAVAGGPTVLQWDADPTLERGDFVLDGPGRIVDGRTDVALRNLYDRLTHH